MKCVYGIINIKNGKIYVGSTTNFSRRKGEHLWMLKNNKHKNPHLQSAWNKYGEEYFKFIILEKITDDRSVYDVEQIYIDKYKSYEKKIGYNLCRFSNTIDNTKTKKKVYQYDYECNLIKVFDSIAEAGESLNSNYSGISHCCRGINKTYKNFIWVYENNNNVEYISQIAKFAKNRKHTEETKKRISETKNKKDYNIHVIQMDINNNFIAEYKSIKEASRNTRANEEVISGCCKGKYKKGKGFLWKFKE